MGFASKEKLSTGVEMSWIKVSSVFIDFKNQTAQITYTGYLDQQSEIDGLDYLKIWTEDVALADLPDIDALAKGALTELNRKGSNKKNG